MENQSSFTYVNEIENTIDEIVSNVNSNIESGKERLNNFVSKFKEKYPSSDIREKASAEALIWALFDVPITLLYIHYYSAVYIELYSILEFFVLRDLPNMLAKGKKSSTIIRKLIYRKNLPDVLNIFEEYGIWSKEDCKFVRKLSNIRNGVAHKNTKLIAKHLANGKDFHMLDIESVVNQNDCAEYILKTVELLQKFSRTNTAYNT